MPKRLDPSHRSFCEKYKELLKLPPKRYCGFFKKVIKNNELMGFRVVGF